MLLNISKGLLQDRKFTCISFEELYKTFKANIGCFERFFSEEPFSYWSNNCKGLLEELSVAPGIKARVPIKYPSQMIDISKKFAFLFDLVVFSPAPLWPPPCNTFAKSPWPEFNDGSVGIIGPEVTFHVNPDIVELFAALIATSPFIQNGIMAYMPQIGPSLHQWDHKILGLRKLPHPSIIEEDVKQNALRERAAIQLYIDNLASKRMGCIHILPSLLNADLGIDDIAFNAYTSHKTQILLSIEIPYLLNASIDDLAKIINDEYSSVVNFRQSIRAAIESIPKNTDDPFLIKRYIMQIQKDVIEEPLRVLKSKLTRIASYYTLKMAGYVVASTIMFISSASQIGIFSGLEGIVGTINLLNIYSEYLNYIKERAQLRDDSAFWLFKIQKGYKG